MPETIYSIPIKDAFGRDSCPLCALRAEAEARSLEYILGGAHMEPAVRADTNRLGFCAAHMEKMLGMKSRLSLALLLESRMAEMQGGRAPLNCDCYICRRVSAHEEAYISNTVHLLLTDAEFADVFRGHSGLCPSHAGALLAAGARLRGSKRRQLEADVRAVINPKLDEALSNLRTFIKSFDHRSDAPLSEAERAALESAVRLLG